MKRKIIIPLVLSSFLVAGCVNEAETKLNKPVLSVNETEDGLVWAAVTGADHYEISINNSEAKTAENYEFAKEVGEYSVKVRAVDAEGKYSDYSDAFEYKTVEPELVNLTVTNNIITWDSANAKYIEVSVNGGDYTKIKDGDKSYKVEGIGLYSFRANLGWNGTNKTFVYANAPKIQTVFVSPKADKPFVVEDGSAEDDLSLMENYTIEKYDSGWNQSSARMSPVEDGKEIFGMNSIKLQAWCHGAWFKFAKNINISGYYDTVEIAARTDTEGSRMHVCFEVVDNYEIAGNQLKGTYLYYELPELSSLWKKYTISLSDPNWKVKYLGTTEVSVSQVLNTLKDAGANVTSIAELLPIMTSAQVKIFAPYTQDGPKMYSTYNGFTLKNTGISETIIEEYAKLSSKYSVDNCALENAQVSFNSDKTKAVITGTYNGVTTTHTFDATLSHSTLTLKEGNTEIVLISDDGGVTFTFESATGDNAEMFNGMNFIEVIQVIDNFESYTETGNGYDQSHTKDQRSGARASYYSDYYTGNDSDRDEFAGAKWKLMGSTDYLGLDKNKAHTGSQSLQCKASDWNALRMASWDLLAGDGEAWPTATTFSFWAKGGKFDHKLKIRIYSVPRVGADLNNAGSNTDSVYKEIILPANSDWTEYTVTLSASKTYYGFAITTDHSSGQMGTTDYYNIDDIMIYGSTNPWEN